MQLHIAEPRQVNAASGLPQRKYRSARRHFEHGICLAPLRAVTGAKLYLRGDVPTVEAAAAATGSNKLYVKAALILIKAENKTLLDDVLAGRVPLLAAAKQIQRVSAMVSAYRAGLPADWALFGKIIGVGELFDGAIVPAL